jgi:hypothetical protein
MTDGQPDKKEGLPEAMSELKMEVQKLQKSRFLCVGLSKDHDASLMRQIQALGNQPGQFIYIDESKKDHTQKLNDCLVNSFNSAKQDSNALSVTFTGADGKTSDQFKLEPADVYTDSKQVK